MVMMSPDVKVAHQWGNATSGPRVYLARVECVYTLRSGLVAGATAPLPRLVHLPVPGVREGCTAQLLEIDAALHTGEEFARGFEADDAPEVAGVDHDDVAGFEVDRHGR